MALRSQPQSGRAGAVETTYLEQNLPTLRPSMVRLLFIRGSILMTRLVWRLFPREVSIWRVCSFRVAESVLRNDTPDAVILNLTPCHLDWDLLERLCRGHEPPVPILFCATGRECIAEVDKLPCPADEILLKPFRVSAFRARVETLLEVARRREPTVAPRLRQDSRLEGAGSWLRIRSWRSRGCENVWGEAVSRATASCLERFDRVGFV